MLMIFLMAIVSFYLVPSYSNQEARIIIDSGSTPVKGVTTGRPFAPQTLTVTERRRLNGSRPSVTTAVTNGHAAIHSSTDGNNGRRRRGRKKPATKSKKKRSKKDSEPARSISNFNVLPKSDLQVVQFYAQPLNTFDVSLQPITVAGGDGSVDYDSFSGAQYAVDPATSTSAPYKTIPQQYVPSNNPLSKPFILRSNVQNWDATAGIGRQTLKTIPLYDPFKLYKTNRQPVYKHRALIPVLPAPKIIPTVRPPLGPVAITQIPPVTVTHVYKYASEPGGDDFDDIPILSAALNEHFNDRSPSRFTHPSILFNTPPKILNLAEWNRYVTAAAAAGRLRDDQLVAKYNEQLRGGGSGAGDDVDESQEEKHYSDKDVKKALEYIRKLKKTTVKGRTAARGSKKFEREKNANKKNNKEKDEEELGADEDEDGDESIRKSNKRPKSKNNDEFFDGENDGDFEANGFLEEDKTQEESRKKVVKTERNENWSASPQENQIVPDVKEDVDENNAQSDVMLENTEIGGEEHDERVEFQMHGMKGPESYKFGYDTGKGENRQFRYEERDPEGRVKGHFGYYDRDGKLQVYNYEADPEHGYHLEKVSEH